MHDFPDYTASALFGQQNQHRINHEQNATPYLPTQKFPHAPLSSTPSSLASIASEITPTDSTVVIGKGSLPKKAPGNRKLREMVRDRVQEYASANSKIAKSSIVTDIYFAIEESCRKEGSLTPFVRYDRNGYSKISETLGREKITSTFRDCLSDRYRSSSKNKVARRRLENQKKAEHKRGLILRSSLSLDQQHPGQQKSMVPILPSPDDCVSSYPSFIPSSCPPQPQENKQQEQYKLHDSNKRERNFIDICSKLFFSGSSTDGDSNTTTPPTTSSGPALFEFDPSFLEPVPIPELDCCSCSSSSCSGQESDSCSNYAKDGFDGFTAKHCRLHARRQQ